MNQLCEIVRAIDDAKINITLIEWNGVELNIETTEPDKTSKILKEFEISNIRKQDYLIIPYQHG